MPPLLTARRDDRQQAFDEPTPLRALGAETDFAPDHGGSQRPFGGIVRGFDPLAVGKGPERVPPVVERVTEIVYLRPGARLSIRDALCANIK